MATMTIKNLPDSLYEALRQSAARHRRSINSEAIVCFERALTVERVDPDGLLAGAREVRARTPALFVTDDVLRAARDDGRP